MSEFYQTLADMHEEIFALRKRVEELNAIWNSNQEQLDMAYRDAATLHKHVAELEAERNEANFKRDQMNIIAGESNKQFIRERDAAVEKGKLLCVELGNCMMERDEWKRKYAERTPTQWAYEQVCTALHKHEAERDAWKDKAETATAERDAARAEVARMREALERIVNYEVTRAPCIISWFELYRELEGVARAALESAKE